MTALDTTALDTTARWWGALNATLLRIGRQLGWIALALMVAIILAQVFWRYVLDAALPWPEEAARGLMIWMMALVAPTAYRWQGFVAIDTVPDLLARGPRLWLTLTLQLLALVVLIVMLGHAWTHFSSPILFNSSGLNRLWQDTGINGVLGTEIEFRTSYIYLAMSVGVVMLISVTGELLVRTVGRLWSGDDERFALGSLPLIVAE